MRPGASRLPADWSPTPTPRRAAPPAAPLSALPAAFGIDACDHLLAEHLQAVRRRFGPAALGVIDLPALGPGRLVREQIRICAVLYWASEIEQAGLLPFIEALAEGIVRGSIVEPLGAVMPELSRFWRSREHRFTGDERRALFARIFGAPADASTTPPGSPAAPAMPMPQTGFPSLFIDMIRALIAIGRAPSDQGTGHLEARASVIAQQLGGELSNMGVGVAGFAARDIVTQIRTAFRLLEHPDLARTLGPGSPWQIVSRHAQRLLGRPVRPDTHVTRAVSGMRILSWIAAEAPAIEAGGLHLARTSPVIRDAETWGATAGRWGGGSADEAA